MDTYQLQIALSFYELDDCKNHVIKVPVLLTSFPSIIDSLDYLYPSFI